MIPAAAQEFCSARDVLRDLLHSVSQPITTLHCALERSLELDEAGPSENVLVALEQTDRVIEAVCLMREYVDAEQSFRSSEPRSVTNPINSSVERVLQQLSVLAEARGVRLFACGRSKAFAPIADVWLERALCYLVGALIEGAPTGAAITILLEDGATRSSVSGHCLPASPSRQGALPFTVSNTLWQARVAIARRALESSGAALEFYCEEKPGFTIRFPKSMPSRKMLSA
ncbi:MAG: hypothetical protein WBS24_03025 [Terriglobales bacterium]